MHYEKNNARKEAIEETAERRKGQKRIKKYLKGNDSMSMNEKFYRELQKVMRIVWFKNFQSISRQE